MRIAQYADSPGDTWGLVNPETLDKGLGGRESAAVYLAEAWAKMGHEVTVFARNPITGFTLGRTAKGGQATYVDQDLAPAMMASFEYDAILSWEEPSLFGLPGIRENCPALLCGMQVAHIPTQEPHIVEYPDSWVALSPWAAKFMEAQGNGYMRRVDVMPNGTRLSRFPKRIGRPNDGPPSFLYASSPDRGLVHLLRAWPQFRAAFPGCRLFVAYGIGKFIDGTKWSHNIQGEMAVDIEILMSQEGVVHLGKIGQDELANYHGVCDMLLYPCDPMGPTETGCFLKGTPVDCPRDHEKYPDGIPIEQLRPGQLVWTINETTQKYELKPVTEVALTRKNAPILRLTLDSGKIIEGTREHPFMLRDGSWKAMGDLCAGDSLMPFYRDWEPRVRMSPTGRYMDEYRAVAEAVFPDAAWGQLGGMVAHHVDERHVNSSPENLRALTRAEHQCAHGRVGWAYVNANLTEQQIADRSARIKTLGAERWLGKSDMEKSEEWHRTHSDHRCMFPCISCERVHSFYAEWPAVEPTGANERKAFRAAKKRYVQFSTEMLTYNHKVLLLEDTGRHEDVYNIEVADNHNYVVHGVVVHNCITAIEAMAAGNVPLMTDADCLKTEFGEVAPIVPLPWEPTIYINEVKRLLEDDKEYERYQQLGRKFAEGRDWDVIAPRWIKLFKAITRANKAKALTH